MARIRTIKPEFYTSLDMAEHDLFTRFVYIGLWTHCDDYGRCIFDPRLIRAALFALDETVTTEDLRKALESLHDAGQVAVYDNAGRTYLQVVKWDEHQKVSHPGRDMFPGQDDPGSALRNVSGEPPETLRPEQGTGNRERKATGEHPPAPKADPPEPTPPDDFQLFWDQYPRKTNRKKAELGWKRLTAADRAAARAALPNHCAKWARDGKGSTEFIPHASTWLTNRRWEDQLAPARRSSVNNGQVVSGDGSW